MTCSDKVRFHVTDNLYKEEDLCYDPRGSADILIANNGKMDIEGFVITMIGEKATINITYNRSLKRVESQLININFQMSKIGRPNKIYIRPYIIYEEEKMLCEFNRYALVNIQECTG
jgi:hypothetical protein